MDIIVAKTLTDNKYKIEVYVNNVTANDQAKLDDFGEPLIQFGGLMDTATPAPQWGAYDPEMASPFTVASGQKKLISQFSSTAPVTYIFDADTDADAKKKANDIAEHLKFKIDQAWDALVVQTDDFTDNTPGEVTPLTPA